MDLENQPALLQTRLQSYSHHDNMVLAQRQKYTMEKRISLTSGAKKICQPPVKE